MWNVLKTICAASSATASASASFTPKNAPTPVQTSASSTIDTRARAQMMFMFLRSMRRGVRTGALRNRKAPARASSRLALRHRRTAARARALRLRSGSATERPAHPLAGSGALGEPVAAAAHRFDHSIAARGLERGAQTLDMHVDGPFLDEHVVAPHLIEQLRAAVHALRMRHEEVQQTELGRAEIELDLRAFGVRRDAVRGRVELETVDGDHVFRELRRAAAQDRLDARHQFLRRKRLRDVVVGADFEAKHLVLLVAARGQHDDRNMLRALVVAQIAREIDARLARQHPVEQDEVGQHVADQVLRLFRVVRANRAMTRVLQVHGNQLGNRGLIFDDENAAGHRHLWH
ncbi:exported hypothetical protein [Paraburkholderia tropica]